MNDYSGNNHKNQSKNRLLADALAQNNNFLESIMQRIIILLFLAIFFLAHSASAQNTELMGLIDDKLVIVDSLTGEIEIYSEISPLPAGERHDNLTYHNVNQLFYSIKGRTNSPALASISQDGAYSLIAPLTLNGNQVLLAEALAYNSINNKLYASVSLDGSAATNDFCSETIVEVDAFTGQCTFITDVSTNVSNPDIDVMTFAGNYLYMFDGAPPGANYSYIYKSDFNDLASLSNPDLIYQNAYMAIRDFTARGQFIYFTVERKLYRFRLSSSSVELIGTTHQSTTFNGKIMHGISQIEICNRPDIELGDDLVFCGQAAVTLDATYSEASYIWQDGSTKSTFEAAQSGTYWVEVMNSCGLSRDSIEITFETMPAINLGSDKIICNNTPITLDATLFGATYTWQDGAVESTYEVTQSGTYWVEVKNSCGISQDTLEIAFETMPIINLGSDKTICNNTPVTLDATSLGATYTWLDGTVESTFEVTQSGTHWVEVMNSCGLSRDSIEITFETMPAINLGNDKTICNNTPVTLDATFLGATYTWQDGTVESTYEVTQSGTYWIEVKNSCGISQDTLEIAFETAPTIDLGENKTICDNTPVMLDATFMGATYKWQDGTIESLYEVGQSGTYWVTLENACGVFTDSIRVEKPDFENVQIPNVITPNGDSFNEHFEIDERLTGSNIEIFQRWGNLVYESKNYQNNWNGHDSSNGTYFYLITDRCGTIYKGWFQIMR